jgi:hypothetical protein
MILCGTEGVLIMIYMLYALRDLHIRDVPELVFNFPAGVSSPFIQAGRQIWVGSAGVVRGKVVEDYPWTKTRDIEPSCSCLSLLPWRAIANPAVGLRVRYADVISMSAAARGRLVQHGVARTTMLFGFGNKKHVLGVSPALSLFCPEIRGWNWEAWMEWHGVGRMCLCVRY